MVKLLIPCRGERRTGLVTHRYTGARLLEIGNRFDIGESAVSQNIRRFSERLSRDRDLRKATNLVKKELGIPSV